MEVRLIHRQGDVEENEDPANDIWSDGLNANEVDGGVCSREVDQCDDSRGRYSEGRLSRHQYEIWRILSNFYR